MPSRQLQVGSIKSLLDVTIDRHAEAYLAAYPEIKEFSNFEKSGTINYYIGMVWTNDFERCDTSQIKIRGSYSLSKNKTLELDLSNVDQMFSFFPGQIVAFSADPYLKRQLTVRKFLDPMKVAPVIKKIETNDRIKLIIAVGPYMDSDNEEWLLIDKLIEQIKTQQATHIILVGPFIDIENKSIKNHFDADWKLLFGKLVEGLYELECDVFLVPSLRDILPYNLNSNYFFPQAEINVDLISLKEGIRPKCSIKSVSNPSQIDLGGLYVDVTSAEVLFHLHKCTSFVNRGVNNIFNPMFRHIITHGIYPIHPAPLDMPVDYTSLAEYTKLDRLGAHLIILPTKFTTGVSNVENRVIVTVQKCSLKRHVVVLDIPRIESDGERPITSLYETDFSDKIVSLVQVAEQSNVGAIEKDGSPVTNSEADVELRQEQESPILLETCE